MDIGGGKIPKGSTNTEIDVPEISANIFKIGK